jgi:small-conductance mechanosensitive channel
MDEIEELPGNIGDALRAVWHELLSVDLLIQFGLILLAAVVATFVTILVRPRIDLTNITMGWPPLLRLWVRRLSAHLGVLVFALLLMFERAVMLSVTTPVRSSLIGVVASLATAWVVIALLASIIRNRFVYRLAAAFAWIIVALGILDLLDPVMQALDSVGIAIGGLRLTPLLVIKTTVLLLLTLWVAAVVGDFLDRRLRTSGDLTPSIQVLLGKLIRLVLITFAILVALSTVGIDLTALAFFSGAVGVGLGFGLQKIVSNLVSGIILLADKSIKPGDVITVGESFGWVGSMGARATSVRTRDGREFLIPNEDFITQQVINWSYSNEEVRLDVDFGVSYASDPHQVIHLAVEAAMSAERVLKEPRPVCHLVGFGDSSIDFKLRIWIRDPIDGVTNVRGQVMLALWDSLKRGGVQIPFPQRDLNMRTPVQVEMVEARKTRPAKT